MSVRAAEGTHHDRELRRELDRQLAVLVARGYAEVAGLAERELRERVDVLRPLLAEVDPASAVPFVVVVGRELASPGRALERVERRGVSAISALDDAELERFVPIETVGLPASPVYLLAGVDTGAELRNVTPDEALTVLMARGRSPLTMDEGIALVTQFPEALAKGAGFSLLGSRCGDRRVTALWIGAGRPKLGWCWAGNPHTWLGSASCTARLAG